MGKSCKEEADALTRCMIKSECMEKGFSLKECLRMKEYQECCMEYRQGYYICKRGQLDMRSRIRGPRGGMSSN